MSNVKDCEQERKENIDMSKPSKVFKKIWTFSLILYIICSSAFSYGDLRMLNTYALYFFLGVSVSCILVKGKVKANYSLLSIILYAMILMVGFLYTPSRESVVRRLLYNYATMAVIVICVIQFIDSKEDISHILTAYMLAGLALAIYVYAQYGNEFWTIMQENTEATDTDVNRIGSELANANTIGLYTAISAMIAIYKLIYEKNKLWKKLLYIAIMVFCFIIDMASASKKGVIMLAVVAICMWLYSAWGSKNILKQLRNIGLLIAAFVIVYRIIINTPAFSGIVIRMEGLFDVLGGTGTNASDATRMNLVKTAISVWLENPIFGAGTYSSSYYMGIYAHNNYVELLMNSGIVGFVVFYFPQIAALFKYLTCYKQYKENSKLSILLFALFAGILVCGMAAVYYFDRYFMILIVTICAATTMLEKKEQYAEQLK